jgi:hypothetical protein
MRAKPEGTQLIIAAKRRKAPDQPTCRKTKEIKAPEYIDAGDLRWFRTRMSLSGVLFVPSALGLGLL